jgi:ferrous iron transport protein B
LFLLDRTGVLPRLEHWSQPLVVGGLGLPAKAADAFLVGFLRRDYGAAGFYALRRAGQLDGVQSVVALTVITLFVPCIANFFVMIKERGLKTALAIVAFIVPFAFAVGVFLNWALRVAKVAL